MPGSDVQIHFGNGGVRVCVCKSSHWHYPVLEDTGDWFGCEDREADTEDGEKYRTCGRGVWPLSLQRCVTLCVRESFHPRPHCSCGSLTCSQTEQRRPCLAHKNRERERQVTGKKGRFITHPDRSGPLLTQLKQKL